MNAGSYDVISKVIPEKCGYLCFTLSSARALQRCRRANLGDVNVMIKLLIAVLAILCADAVASDWDEFEKRDGVISYIDLDSLMVQETTYTFWIKSVYSKPQKMNPKSRGSDYLQKLELMRVNCAGRSYYLEKTIYLSKDGDPLITKRSETGPETVVPDTPVEVRYNAICKMRFARARALMNQGARLIPPEERKPQSKWSPLTK